MSIPKEVFPPLKGQLDRRLREYNEFNDEYVRACIVFLWVVEGWTTRTLDDQILHCHEIYPNQKNKGWLSHGILGYFGLLRAHQGFFKGWNYVDILAYLQPLCLGSHDIDLIYKYLLIYISKINIIDIEKPTSEVASQDWINNVLLKNVPLDSYNQYLSALPDKKKEVLVENQTRYYSDVTVKQSLKDLYDFRCQVCGAVILKTGWNSSLDRKSSWDFLSADVHHILPLSKKGPDLKSNMMCLCPTCHRKFHTGEYRLTRKKKILTLSDELLGFSKELGLLNHSIILY